MKPGRNISSRDSFYIFILLQEITIPDYIGTLPNIMKVRM